MAKVMEQDFCINCRKDTAYKLKQKDIKKVIRGKEYKFHIEEAVCCECGEPFARPVSWTKIAKQ